MAKCISTALVIPRAFDSLTIRAGWRLFTWKWLALNACQGGGAVIAMHSEGCNSYVIILCYLLCMTYHTLQLAATCQGLLTGSLIVSYYH
jgi:hypothetical protein